MANLSICLYSVLEANLPLGLLLKYMITLSETIKKNGTSY